MKFLSLGGNKNFILFSATKMCVGRNTRKSSKLRSKMMDIKKIN